MIVSVLRKRGVVRWRESIAGSDLRLHLGLLTLLALGCGGGVGRSPLPAIVGHQCSGCNLLLISIDTLRADSLSAYGAQRPTSPTLDALAHDGVLFEQFLFSGGGTLPSHLTMLTSLNPVTHGIHPRSPRRLEDARQTLAEYLLAAGYRTMAVTDGGWMSRKFGFDQGFEEYHDEPNLHLEANLPLLFSWLRKHKDVSFFQFVHTYDVHSEHLRLPYDCPPEYRDRWVGTYNGSFDGCVDGRCASSLLAWINAEISSGRALEDFVDESDVAYLRSLYDGCVSYADSLVGRLVHELRELGLYDRTLIVVTSDHGEEFAEHGRFLHEQAAFEELARIPLILKLPYSLVRGVRVPHLAAMVDLMPTLLDLLALDARSDVQGFSLVPAILERRPVRDAVHMYEVLRTDRYKYFRNSGDLYDLAIDREEKRRLNEAQPERISELATRLNAMITDDHEARARFEEEVRNTGPEVEMTPEELDRLRALGYVN